MPPAVFRSLYITQFNSLFIYKLIQQSKGTLYWRHKENGGKKNTNRNLSKETDVVYTVKQIKWIQPIQQLYDENKTYCGVSAESQHFEANSGSRC
jgi:hypothetical protein